MIQIREVIIEPNKTYVNQKFKVKIRVQDDYKYRKRIITENVKIRTLTAEDFTITDADTSRKANIIEIQGNTMQDGTPSPDNEVEVQNVTGDNYIVVSNKNKFDKNAVTNGYYLNENGGLTANANYCVSEFIPVIEGQSYYLPTRGTTRTKFYKKDKSAHSNTWDVGDGNRTFSVPTGVAYIRFSIAIAGSTAVNLNTFQFEEGTTATDFIEHQGKKYRVDFGGKNKFNTSQRTITWKSIVVEESSRKVVLKPTTSGGGYVRYVIDNIKSNQAYTLSCESIEVINSTIDSKGQLYIREYNSEGTMHYISVINANNLSRTFTTQSDTVQLALDFYSAYGTEDNYENMEIRYIGIQLEKGKNQTAFSPHVENPIELCKIGTYQDYIYKSGNKWYKHKVVEKTKIDGSFTNYISVSNRTITTRFGICHLMSNASNPLLCNRFSYTSTIYAQDVQGCWWAGGTEEILYFSVPNSIATTKQEFKDWLLDNNLSLYYPLTEPIEEEITNESLIAQLEELQRIDMYDDLTYVDFDGNVKGTMKLEYATNEQFKKYIVTENGKILRTDWGE